MTLVSLCCFFRWLNGIQDGAITFGMFDRLSKLAGRQGKFSVTLVDFVHGYFDLLAFCILAVKQRQLISLFPWINSGDLRLKTALSIPAIL